jgi:ABC-type glycerol-3-phosphate transport system permease component
MLFKLASNLWVPFSRYIFNSLFIAVVATAGHVIISSLAAYPLAKYKLRLLWLFDIVVMALLFSATVLWIPQYVIMSQMKIINTYLVYILPALPAPIGLFLMKQFMEQIPFVLIESATIDGASQWKIFWKVVMPQVKPAWLTLMVFAFLSTWNQQAFGLVFNEELKTINDAISQIMAGGFSRLGVSMAGSIFVIIPPIIVFIVSQDKVIETMAYSGIKG